MDPFQPVLARKSAVHQAVHRNNPTAVLLDQEEYLVRHFCGTLAELISFSQSGTTNAFTVHLLPLVRSSSLMLGAVETLAAAHLQVSGAETGSDVQDLHSKTLRCLSSQLNAAAVDTTSVPLAMTGGLLLVYYEVRTAAIGSTLHQRLIVSSGHTRRLGFKRSLPSKGRQSIDRSAFEGSKNDGVRCLPLDDKDLSLL